MFQCFVCAKNNESVKKVTDNPPKFLCSQCLKGGTYKQDYHLKPGAYDKGFNLFKGNRFVAFYPSRTKAIKALYERFNNG